MNPFKKSGLNAFFSAWRNFLVSPVAHSHTVLMLFPASNGVFLPLLQQRTHVPVSVQHKQKVLWSVPHGTMCLFNVIWMLSSLGRVQTLACMLWTVWKILLCQKWGKPAGFGVCSVWPALAEAPSSSREDPAVCWMQRRQQGLSGFPPWKPLCCREPTVVLADVLHGKIFILWFYFQNRSVKCITCI